MGSSVVVTLALYTMLGVKQLFSKRQVVFFAAVASVCWGGLISVQYFMVVFLNDSFHIVHV